jgi:hypothetical protein
MNKQEIAEVMEIAKKATEGPWEVEIYYHDAPYSQFIKSAAVVKSEPNEDGGISKYTITRNNWSNPLVSDLDFIALARTALPQLAEQCLAQLEVVEAARHYRNLKWWESEEDARDDLDKALSKLGV